MFDENSIPFQPIQSFDRQKPLLILGMHRSGTSFVANWLTKCGFNFGDELLGPGTGNDEGHFEDVEILQFHEQILKDNRKNYQMTSSGDMLYSSYHLAEATMIYKQRMYSQNWGWKDPRTCLMMDLWQQILPGYRCLVVFRDYRQVVDSLLRRKHKTIREQRNLIEKSIQYIKYRLFDRRAVNRFLQVWNEYNRRILQTLAKMDPSDYLVVNELHIGDYDLMLFRHIEKNWAHRNLNYIPVEKVFKPGLIVRHTTDYDFEPGKLEQAEAIMQQLEMLEYDTTLRLSR